MKITFFGTTTLLFDDGDVQILFDAHFSRPPLYTMFCGKVRTDTAIIDRIFEQHGINRLKAIFISHSHHDHVMDCPYIARKCKADIYGSRSTLNVARGGGVAEEKLHLYELKDDGKSGVIEIGDYKIRVFRSIHSKPKWYNNDIGQEISSPLLQPASRRAYKEGGSYDFYIEHRKKTYLIRPSFNYLEGELDGIKADTLFTGIAGLSRARRAMREKFFSETADKVKPSLIIPLHWDNFFISFNEHIRGMPLFIENTCHAFHCLALYCEKSGINCIVQPPLTSIEI